MTTLSEATLTKAVHQFAGFTVSRGLVRCITLNIVEFLFTLSSSFLQNISGWPELELRQ